jgi:hypothetical protein
MMLGPDTGRCGSGNAADLSHIAGEDGVVRPVLVDPGAEAGRAEREGHRSGWPKSHRSHIGTFQVLDLYYAVRLLVLRNRAASIA